MENIAATAAGDDISSTTPPDKNFDFYLQITDVDLSTGATDTLSETEVQVVTFTDENDLRVALPNDGTTQDIAAQVSFVNFVR